MDRIMHKIRHKNRNEVIPKNTLYLTTVTNSFLVIKNPGNKYNINITKETIKSTIKTMGIINGKISPI